MINYKVINILGLICMFLGLSMIPSSLWCLYYNEIVDFTSFIKSISITISIGFLFYILTCLNVKKHYKDLSSKDGFTVVTLGWLTMAIFSALPYYLSPTYNLSFVDSFFESMSGLTTTGATILGDSIMIESLSHGLLFGEVLLNL